MKEPDLDDKISRWQRLEKLREKRRGVMFDLGIIDMEIRELEKQQLDEFHAAMKKAIQEK